MWRYTVLVAANRTFTVVSGIRYCGIAYNKLATSTCSASITVWAWRGIGWFLIRPYLAPICASVGSARQVRARKYRVVICTRSRSHPHRSRPPPHHARLADCLRGNQIRRPNPTTPTALCHGRRVARFACLPALCLARRKHRGRSAQSRQSMCLTLSSRLSLRTRLPWQSGMG
jgi:hypothetical protein